MPDFTDYVRQNLPPLGIAGSREAEIVEELALDFQEKYERALRSGLNAEQAWQEMGNHARPWRELGEELRSALGEQRMEPAEPTEPTRKRNLPARFWEEVTRDLSYAARQLRKSPGFTIVAVVMLALGIGANTAIFSLMNAILLRTLPVRQPEQLVFFGRAQAEGSTNSLTGTLAFSYPFFREFRRRNEAFSEVAAIQSHLLASYGRIAGDADLEKVKVELVSGSYFQTLGVNAALGRVFTGADDERPGAHPVAVASYSWWRNRFAGDRSIAGKSITIGSTVYTIIGVAAPEFYGVTVGQSPDLWIPVAMQKEISPDHNGLEDNRYQSLHVIARRKPGISPNQAQAHTDVVFRQVLTSFVGPQPSREDLNDIQHAQIPLTPAATGRSRLRKTFGSPLEILMAVVALVLLIACANVANLLLARAAGRQREVAVRMSLGAARPRLIRQLLAESGLLGFVGAALGVAFAWSASRLLLTMVSTGSELLPIRVTPDTGVLGFSVAVTVLTVFLFGAAPALRATGLDLAGTLKAGRGVAAAVRNPGGRLTQGLVVGQVTLSVVLLAGAGLFLRSLTNLMHVDVGFDRQNVLRMRIDPRAAGYQRDARLTSMMQRVEERVGAVPGIHSASFAYFVFDDGGWSTTNVTVPGRPASEKDPRVDLNVVGPEYFGVMKIPILLGRALNTRDNEASRKVAVINETMTRTHYPGVSPLGRTFSVGDDPELQNVEVVGVMRDAKYMELGEEQMAAAFFPHAQHRDYFVHNLVVRYTGDPAWLVPAIRKGIAEIDPNLPVGDVRTLAQMVDDFTVNQRLVAQLSTFFGVLAALLASIGIYGVMSYGITRRTHEFGIRMALGAERRDVLWVVLRETLALAIAGAAIGVTLALASGSLLRSLLFGVKSTDSVVMAVSVAAMIGVALFAGFLPARRATRIDPSVALRYE